MRIIGIWFGLTLFVWSALARPAVPAPQPGFDCGKARTPVEKAICRDAALAERDAALALVADLQQKIDTAREQLRAAADADAVEDAGRAGALSALGG